jgi:hypothetical protein
MAREILRYFVRNPHAADSLEGVARWRLMDEVIRRKLDETEAALEWLTAQGYLTTSIAYDGTATFSLNPSPTKDVQQFLADPPAAAPPMEADTRQQRRTPRSRRSDKPRTLR